MAVALSLVYCLLMAWLCPPIATVCDDYLAEGVDVMCDSLGMPEHVAAVSIIAMVSSAPELMISIQTAAGGIPELGLSAQLGSALIAFGLIPAVCTWQTPFLRVHMAPLLRDCISFVLGLITLFAIIQRKGGTTTIRLGDSLVLVLLYALYLCFVLVSHLRGWMGERASYTAVDTKDSDAVGSIDQQWGCLAAAGEAAPFSDDPSENGDKTTNPLVQTHSNGLLHRYQYGDSVDSSTRGGAGAGAGVGVGAGANKREGAAEKQEQEKEKGVEEDRALRQEGMVQRGGAALAFAVTRSHLPLDWLFAHTIPDCTKEGKERMSMLTVIMSLLHLAVLSFILLELATQVVGIWGTNETLAGVSLLCFVAQIPDTLAAMALVKKGMHDTAILHAVSSQVLNITLGLGLPYFVYDVANAEPLQLDDSFCLLILSCLFIVIAMFLFLFFLPLCAGHFCGCCGSRGKAKADSGHTVGVGLTKTTGRILLCTYTVVHVVLSICIAAGADPIPERTHRTEAGAGAAGAGHGT